MEIVDYIAMISLCFLILPFTYFYAEESLESEDEIDFFEVNEYSDDDEEPVETNSTTAASTKDKESRRSYREANKYSCNRIMDRIYKATR